MNLPKIAKANTKSEKASDEKNTTLTNRIFFGTITVFIALFCIKVVTWAVYQGRQPMPLFIWLAVFGSAIFGFALTTLRPSFSASARVNPTVATSGCV
jgi:hypothetical protein